MVELLLHAPVAALGFALTGPAPLVAQAPRFVVELEAGPTWQSANVVEIPNDGTATRFSLVDLVGSGPSPSARLYFTWHLTERDDVRLLVAPLSFRESGTPDRALTFAGETFVTGLPAEATYTFNSYRLMYRRRLYSGPRAAAWLGLTAKVRDASVRLEQGATRGRKDDLGLVPLLHVAADWRPAGRWAVSLDADALAGGPGRAVDASLKFGYELGDRWSLRAGYRLVEGGADVESVYNFAWLNYAVVSVALRL